LTSKKSYIKIDRDKLLSVLVDIEYMLISLRKKGSFYGESLPEKYGEYCAETTAFIDDHEITRKLARMRTILSAGFETVGEDGLSDIERALEGLECWAPHEFQNEVARCSENIHAEDELRKCF